MVIGGTDRRQKALEGGGEPDPLRLSETGAAGEESDAHRERTPMRERLLVGTGGEAVDEREGTLHR